MTGAPERIAIVGLACRLPGAASPEELWSLLREGREAISVLSVDAAQRRDPRYVPAKGVLDGADSFDAAFFGISPREAALIDPQQRVFVETAWSALEDAGYDPRRYEGRIGVFAGSILSMYLLRNLAPNPDLMNAAGNFQIAVGNDPTFLATGTSYRLDLRGPSVSVGTACSTSLVAVHLACQSLLSYESDMALAGGVSIHLPLTGGYRYEDGGVLSPDGHCRPFDAQAQGTVVSDGAGVVVLKRLSDALADGDTIHAVIRGSAMNNDGRMKVGYTAPSVRGEAQVIAEALAMADVEPETISMIETHGAGTLLGDPIEVSALVEAFGDCGGKRGFCALGSIKSNIGHVDAAAGIAGLIKTVLALKHREIPPTLHFQKPNPQLDFAKTPFYVSPSLTAIPDDGRPLRAGVSSFGIGGTNVHLVLEEAPTRQPTTDNRQHLLVLSARTATALEAATDRLADHLEQHPELALADVAHTLRSGRADLGVRRTLVARDVADALAALRARTPQRVRGGAAPNARPSIAFLFPGLGDHYAGMGWELYRTEEVFRDSVDRSAEALRECLGSDIREFLSKAVADATALQGGPKLDLRAMLGRNKSAEPDSPALAQPAIFVVELALVDLLRSWGIEPEAMLGHSIGEFTAATAAGVFSLADAARVVAERGRLIATRVARGAMLAVPLPDDELRPLLPDGVTVGAINAARLCIASGEESGIASLADALAARGVSAQRLRSTHAYHSHMMEPLVEPLAAILRGVELRPPRIPYVSCITGDWITDAQATDPQYWANHLCRTVRFQQGLSRLLEDPQRVLVEAGPGQGLTSHALAERARLRGEQPIIPTMRWSYSLQSEAEVLLDAAGQLWIAGAPLPPTAGRRVPLPTYPFERQRYWIDPPTGSKPTGKRADVADWFYVPSWKPSVRPRDTRHPTTDNWLLIDDEIELAGALRAHGATVATASSRDDFRAVIAERQPRRIVHLGSLSASDDGFAGYSSVLRLIQALEVDVRLDIIGNQLFDTPEKATIRAPAMVAPQEHPGMICRIIDVDTADPDVLLDELLSDAQEPVVAYRGRRRFLPAYEPVRIEAGASPFRPRGVYLLTGGLGGVALIIAEHLARTVQARLVLAGRSAPTTEKLERLRALEALGAEVLFVRADVSRLDDMRRVVAEIDARFGELHGVIHAAGSIGVETFREVRNAPPADAEGQFVAKVRGLMVLDEVLQARKLDFRVAVSSLSAILGGLGFTAYSAANLFMDVFAQRVDGWTSIDWDSWRVADAKPVIAGLGASVSEFVMEPEEGAAALERILSEGSLRQVVVSTGDLDARLRQWIDRRGQSEAAAPAAREERPSLATPYEPPQGELESELAEMWQELFGITPIGVRDNFFALGGHSLLATQLNARLSSRLHVEMSLATLLQAPTIADLAVAIVTQQAELADPDLLEEMLAELES